TGGAECNGKLRRAGVGKLFGVQSRQQAEPLAGLQDALRLRERESAAVAKDVAEFREIGLGELGHQLAGQQLDVLPGTIFLAAKFRGDDVRAEKRRGDLDRLFGCKLPV